MSQNDGFRHAQSVEYLADFPGARREKDRIGVVIEDSVALQLVENIDRLLGTVRPQNNSVWQIQEHHSLDVSAETVPVTSDGPLDVSAATIEAEVTEIPSVELKDGSLPDWGTQHWESIEFEDSEETPEWYPSNAAAPLMLESTGGVRKLSGVVESTGNYNVHLVYGDPDTDLLDVEEIKTGVSGGETTRIDESAITPSCGVIIEDASDTPDDQEVNGLLHVA